jgi:hypothetical protein
MSGKPLKPSPLVSSKLILAFPEMTELERAQFWEIFAKEKIAAGEVKWTSSNGEGFLNCMMMIAERHLRDPSVATRPLVNLASAIVRFDGNDKLTKSETNSVNKFMGLLMRASAAAGGLHPVHVAFSALTENWVMRGWRPRLNETVQGVMLGAFAAKDPVRLRRMCAASSLFNLGDALIDDRIRNLPNAIQTFLAAGGNFNDSALGEPLSHIFAEKSLLNSPPEFIDWLKENDQKLLRQMEFKLVLKKIKGSQGKFLFSPKLQQDCAGFLSTQSQDFLNIESHTDGPIWLRASCLNERCCHFVSSKYSELKASPDVLWPALLQLLSDKSARPNGPHFIKADLLAHCLNAFVPVTGMLFHSKNPGTSTPWFARGEKSHDFSGLMLLSGELTKLNPSPEFWLGSKKHQFAHGIRMMDGLIAHPKSVSSSLVRLFVHLKLNAPVNPTLATSLCLAFAIAGRQVPAFLLERFSHHLVPQKMWENFTKDRPEALAFLQSAVTTLQLTAMDKVVSGAPRASRCRI